MPRKSTMRDNVNVVRSRLPHLSDLPREKIELVLLYYESSIDDTVEAFKRDCAIEALNGWTETSNGRGTTSSKRTNNKGDNRNSKPSTLPTNSSVKKPPFNGILRPSQRVSNIFQTFAEGGTPTIVTTNGSITTSNTAACSPPSTSFSEQSDNNHDLTANHVAIHDEVIEQQNSSQLQTRKHIQDRHDSTSSIKHHHEPSTNSNNQQTTTTIQFSNNKKMLTKSVKDLQRQTSTLTNVEILFDNEIKSSIKHIDDVFKQITEIIKQREIELYLEMDKVKEQGLNIIHNRQKHAIELRQSIDRCDRLEPVEIDNLRHDIKQFVTDRRYELGEQLTTSHRFGYDQKLIELLKNFGHILPIGRTRSTSSALVETHPTTISDGTSEKLQISMISHPISSVSSSLNEVGVIVKQEQPKPQRINNNQQLNDYNTGNNYRYCDSSQQNNGSFQYYDETNNYQSNFQHPRPILNYHNDNNRRTEPKPINNCVDLSNKSKTTNTYRRPRLSPHPSQPVVPVQT
ncbi:unnamed protein product [Rotaria socialis]|uniref:Uncharacterized protein n=1 Tax=Rotaria socialis TaxID=392032 RepID=A0A817N849_9BILA|nr:unnamed protein product [Rotaria socialis]CAF3203151.1 unnamed protein product [Rotaria socialis]CAF3360396.1 unnamed protein product [Rotaria socialis]CAF3591165.1 unnamed protein product [Rotaria socialis]CAF4118981.1 unnamed protein product [Rotaria socialis]